MQYTRNTRLGCVFARQAPPEMVFRGNTTGTAASAPHLPDLKYLAGTCQLRGPRCTAAEWCLQGVDPKSPPLSYYRPIQTGLRLSSIKKFIDADTILACSGTRHFSDDLQPGVRQLVFQCCAGRKSLCSRACRSEHITSRMAIELSAVISRSRLFYCSQLDYDASCVRNNRFPLILTRVYLWVARTCRAGKFHGSNLGSCHAQICSICPQTTR